MKSKNSTSSSSFRICCCGVTLLLLLFVVPSEQQQATNKLSRYEKLKKETAQKTVIRLDTERLNLFGSSKRNYSLVVFLTTDRQDIQCPYCKPIEEEWKIVTEHFKSSLGNIGLESKKWKENPIFLGKCEVMDCQDIFVKAGWRSLPMVITVPPSDSKDTSGQLNLQSVIVMDELISSPTAESIADFVQRTTHYVIDIPQPAGLLMLWVATALAALYVIYKIYEFGHHKSTTFWFIVSMMVFAFSMSGVVYNSIHKPPFFYKNPQNGQIHFIYPSSRSQFVAEGLLMSVLFTTGSILFVGLVTQVPKTMEPWSQRGQFLVLGISLVFVSFWIYSFFKIKFPYYPL